MAYKEVPGLPKIKLFNAEAPWFQALLNNLHAAGIVWCDRAAADELTRQIKSFAHK